MKSGNLPLNVSGTFTKHESAYLWAFISTFQKSTKSMFKVLCSVINA